MRVTRAGLDDAESSLLKRYATLVRHRRHVVLYFTARHSLRARTLSGCDAERAKVVTSIRALRAARECQCAACGDIITPGTMNAKGCTLAADGWRCGICEMSIGCPAKVWLVVGEGWVSTRVSSVHLTEEGADLAATNSGASMTEEHEVQP